MGTLRTPGGGRPNWFFVKRPVLAEMHPTLAALGIGADTTPSVSTYTEAVLRSLAKPKPARAPAVDWSEALPDAGVQDCSRGFFCIHLSLVCQLPGPCSCAVGGSSSVSPLGCSPCASRGSASTLCCCCTFRLVLLYVPCCVCVHGGAFSEALRDGCCRNRGLEFESRNFLSSTVALDQVLSVASRNAPV